MESSETKEKDGDMEIEPNKDESGETTDTSSEKNESKEVDDEDVLSCTECKTSECFMWRRLNNSTENLICSLCHLKRLKSETTLQSSNNTSSNKSTQSSTSSNSSNSKSKQQDNIRISKRKNKTNKKFTNGFMVNELSKMGIPKVEGTCTKRSHQNLQMVFHQ